MLFSTMTFIYIFLPALCLTYFLVRKDLRNFVLLLASFIFYAWGEPTYLIIMILTILTNYVGALLIDKFVNHKKLCLLLTIAVNLGFLIYFKYFNFLIENINALFRTNIDFINVIMPIGISFYTFQAMSYIIDVYREKVQPQKNLYKLALYISLFPQLVAGPVVRYGDIIPQIENREHSFDKVVMGVQRFVIGLSKKVLIANTLGEIADKVFMQQPDTFSHLTAWLGVSSYMLQIYYDFSGYSDMAIGLGMIFGFRFMENFNHPYYAKSMTDAWHKWHISVSNWFKDYVFVLKWNKLVPDFVYKFDILNKMTKGKYKFKKSYVNVIATFFLIGLWHGASWSFALWGLWHGFFIIFENMTGWTKQIDTKMTTLLKHIYVPLVALLGFVLFRSENIPYAMDYYKNMFGVLDIHDIKYTMSYYLDNQQIIVFVIAFFCCAPIFAKTLETSKNNKFFRFALNSWLLILFVLSTAAIASSTYNPFIYFRF